MAVVDRSRRRHFRVFRFFRGYHLSASCWSVCWRIENHEIGERNEKKLTDVRKDVRTNLVFDDTIGRLL